MSSRLCIVSGGQTGVDRAALDAARSTGVDIGGWCPVGRWAEDGRIPLRYPLQETASPDPAERTRLNVRDSDATLILHDGPLRGGTALTLELAAAFQRPARLVDVRASPTPGDTVEWIRQLDVRVLNVAGPRESESPGIYVLAVELVTDVIHALRLEGPGQVRHERSGG